MRIRSFLFDMDGVLIDSLSMDLVAVNRIIGRRFGRTVDDDFIRSIFAYDIPEFWGMILGKIEVPADPGIQADIIREYREIRNIYEFKLLPGVVELLEAVKGRGCPCAVASNNSDDDIHLVLQKVKLTRFFDVIVGNDHIARKKPNPDIYIYAAGRMNVDIKQAAVLEDSVVGVQAGMTAGAWAIGVATGGTAASELRSAGAHKVVDTLLQIELEKLLMS
ncbi:MAG: HAD family phosphatase [Deltaproteobacteria bacterium]|nr:HAD family phosphatase [Deltaproteobacteria bacterium]